MSSATLFLSIIASDSCALSTYLNITIKSRRKLVNLKNIFILFYYLTFMTYSFKWSWPTKMPGNQQMFYFLKNFFFVDLNYITCINFFLINVSVDQLFILFLGYEWKKFRKGTINVLTEKKDVSILITRLAYNHDETV